MIRRLAMVVMIAGSVWAQGPVKFMGRVVTVTKPKLDDSGMFPEGPATVCVEGPPRRQCYTAPKDFGRDPDASIVQIEKSTPAIFFIVAADGVSGFPVHFALLHPGEDGTLEDLFGSELYLSERGQHSWWSEPSISAAKMFVTADYVWASGECHGCDHRWIISTYLRKAAPGPLGVGEGMYDLEDRYMTVRRYEENDRILGTEKPEILARLKRVKQQSPR